MYLVDTPGFGDGEQLHRSLGQHWISYALRSLAAAALALAPRQLESRQLALEVALDVCDLAVEGVITEPRTDTFMSTLGRWERACAPRHWTQAYGQEGQGQEPGVA